MRYLKAKGKAVAPEPIQLTVHSPNVPNLTLVDMPGAQLASSISALAQLLQCVPSVLASRRPNQGADRRAAEEHCAGAGGHGALVHQGERRRVFIPVALTAGPLHSGKWVRRARMPSFWR